MTSERVRIGWKAAVHDRKIASLRYRVESPVRALQALGYAVEMFDPQRETDYDVVIFAKTYSLQDRALAGRVRARGGRVVFDLCDNHFYNPNNLPKYRQVREELLDMLSLAQQVVCTTPQLAEVVRREAPWAADPVVIGDAVEHVEPTAPSLEPFAGTRLLWFGSQGSPNAPSGMADILKVRDHLTRAAERSPIELVVCSNSRERFDELIAPLPFATRYVRWTLEGFNGVLASADGVIIPISPNPFTLCKTHNRLTTALDAAVPVIADGIDSYREFAPFCALDDWDGGLRQLVDDPQGARSRAAAGRDYLLQRWTSDVLAVKWRDALGLVTQPAPGGADQVAQLASAMALNSQARAGGTSEAALICQGALDRRAADAVSGWVRGLTRPEDRLSVRLYVDGQEAAYAVADQPRPDLAAAGFPVADCGFSFPAPKDRPGADLEVRVDGTDWRFPQSVSRLQGDQPRGRRAAPEPTALSYEAVRTFTFQDAGAADGSAGGAHAAVQIQAELLEQLQSLEALMDSARHAAARLILAAGDDPALGRRLLSMLDRDLKPELRRMVSWGEAVEGPPSPLN